MPEKKKQLKRTTSRELAKNMSMAYHLPQPSSSEEDEVSRTIPHLRKIVTKKDTEKQRLL